MNYTEIVKTIKTMRIASMNSRIENLQVHVSDTTMWNKALLPANEKIKREKDILLSYARKLNF
ncbi:MAG: hypothetical protein JWR18_183 [Segetibacter sp.]|jgi:hypothetical protein|nr:hypothetical protein [Segetibacter sp.]